jgi:hypothetical protein
MVSNESSVENIWKGCQINPGELYLFRKLSHQESQPELFDILNNLGLDMKSRPTLQRRLKTLDQIFSTARKSSNMHTNKVLLALKSVAFSVVIFDAVKSFTIYNVVLQNASVSATSAPSPSSVAFAADEVRIVSNAFLYLFLYISLSCRTVVLAVATALLRVELAAMPAVELVAQH